MDHAHHQRLRSLSSEPASFASRKSKGEAESASRRPAGWLGGVRISGGRGFASISDEPTRATSEKGRQP
jgi:hypothetical protein